MLARSWRLYGDFSNIFSGLQQTVHCRGSVPLHVWEHMGVEVERDRDRGMPEHLRDDLGMNALEQQCRSGVAQIMETYQWQTCLLEDRWEVVACDVAPRSGRSTTARLRQ